MLEWLTKLREPFTYICKFIIKNKIKHKDEQPNEEVHRERSRRVLSAELLYSWNWGAPPSQHMDVFSNL